MSAATQYPQRRLRWQHFIDTAARLSPFGALCAAVVLLYAVAAVCAPLGLLAVDWDRIGDVAYAPFSAEHWFGTNRNGQDVLARSLYACTAAFELGLVAALSSTLLGVSLGAVAGGFGRGADAAVLWLAGLLESVPFYLLAAALAFAFQGWPWAVHVAVALSFWPPTARPVRAEILRLRHQPYIDAARVAGLSPRDILRDELVPQCAHLALVQGSLSFVAAIKVDAVLSFIGIGVQDGLSWGLMLAQAAQEIPAGHWGNFAAASLALTGLVLSLSWLGDELQNVFNPRSTLR